MKIFTYYEDIGDKNNQEAMVQIWEKSWKKSGFEPIVLNRSNASSHPYYDDFISQIKDIHLKLMKEPIGDYGVSCYLRWLAYATQENEKFYVSDYDVVSNGFQPIEPEDGICLMDAACPCFASGTAADFDRLCHVFVDISLERLEVINNDCHWYHDQDFFVMNIDKNPDHAALRHKYNLKLTRDRTTGVGPYIYGQDNTCKVIHVSHHNVATIKEENQELKNENGAELRIKIMQKFI
jgi:hypothetical protein